MHRWWSQISCTTTTENSESKLEIVVSCYMWYVSFHIVLSNILCVLIISTTYRFGSPVRFCTAYVHAKHTYRCHPCYQSDGPIYDWMKALFDGIVYPCRLLAVVVCDNDEPESEQWHLVVQRTTHKTNVRSVLLTEWWWSPTYYVITPNDIVPKNLAGCTPMHRQYTLEQFCMVPIQFPVSFFSIWS
jgi:hypothetical protein